MYDSDPIFVNKDLELPKRGHDAQLRAPSVHLRAGRVIGLSAPVSIQTFSHKTISPIDKKEQRMWYLVTCFIIGEKPRIS